MRNASIFKLIAAVLLASFVVGCSSMPFGGSGSSQPSAPAETGIGSQLGSVVGGEIGGRYNPLGSTIGSHVGSQTERAVAQSAAAKPTK